MFLNLLKTEIRISLSYKAETIHYLTFLCIIALLFPFSVGSEKQILNNIAPGVIWTSAILANILILSARTEIDYKQNYLRELILTPIDPFLIIITKIIASFLISGFLISSLSFVLLFFFQLPVMEIFFIFLKLTIALLVMNALAIMGSLLVAGKKTANVLGGLITLPFYIPIIIFGSSGRELENLAELIGISLILLPLIVIASGFLLNTIMNKR